MCAYGSKFDISCRGTVGPDVPLKSYIAVFLSSRMTSLGKDGTSAQWILRVGFTPDNVGSATGKVNQE